MIVACPRGGSHLLPAARNAPPAGTPSASACCSSAARVHGGRRRSSGAPSGTRPHASSAPPGAVAVRKQHVKLREVSSDGGLPRCTVRVAAVTSAPSAVAPQARRPVLSSGAGLPHAAPCCSGRPLPPFQCGLPPGGHKHRLHGLNAQTRLPGASLLHGPATRLHSGLRLETWPRPGLDLAHCLLVTSAPLRFPLHVLARPLTGPLLRAAGAGRPSPHCSPAASAGQGRPFPTRRRPGTLWLLPPPRGPRPLHPQAAHWPLCVVVALCVHPLDSAAAVHANIPQRAVAVQHCVAELHLLDGPGQEGLDAGADDGEGQQRVHAGPPSAQGGSG